MASNEWHAWQPPSRRPYQPSYGSSAPAPRPYVQEEILNQKFIQVERKVFAIALKENVRGRFLRITEEANDKHTTVIFPASGLEDLLTVLIEMVETYKGLPPEPEQPAPEQM